MLRPRKSAPWTGSSQDRRLPSASNCANSHSIAFGDFRAALAVRRVNGGQLMTLRERYADYLQVGYFAFERADSVVQDSSAVKLLVQT